MEENRLSEEREYYFMRPDTQEGYIMVLAGALMDLAVIILGAMEGQISITFFGFGGSVGMEKIALVL